MCGSPVVWTGRGRPPVYDSATCRTRAWEARRRGAHGADDEHRAADDPAATPRPVSSSRPTSPAPTVGNRAVPTSARSWAALLDTLAVQLATGELGRRHYDHRHLYRALQQVWVALDVAHPGGIEELQRHRR